MTRANLCEKEKRGSLTIIVGGQLLKLNSNGKLSKVSSKKER